MPRFASPWRVSGPSYRPDPGSVEKVYGLVRLENASYTLSKRGQSLMGHGGYQSPSASADEEGVEVGIKGRV